MHFWVYTVYAYYTVYIVYTYFVTFFECLVACIPACLHIFKCFIMHKHRLTLIIIVTFFWEIWNCVKSTKIIVLRRGSLLLICSQIRPWQLVHVSKSRTQILRIGSETFKNENSTDTTLYKGLTTKVSAEEYRWELATFRPLKRARVVIKSRQQSPSPSSRRASIICRQS